MDNVVEENNTTGQSTLNGNEISQLLSETTDTIDEYREKFDVDSPDLVSVSEYAEENNMDVEEVWEQVSLWKTEVSRRKILDRALKTS